MPRSIVIRDLGRESEVIMLLNEYKSDGTGTPYVIFIDEKGRLKKQLTLSQHQFNNISEYYTSGLGILFLDNYYLMIMGWKGFAILDFDGNDIKWQKVRKTPVEYAALNMTNNEEQYLIIAINYPKSATRSSALFIYNQNWELLYEETLGQLDWIGTEKSLTGEDLILKASDVKNCKLTGAPSKYLRYSIR